MDNGGQWTYGREILLQERSGEMLDYYQVPLQFTADNFDFSHANPNGSDIRVTDSSGYEQGYWIEEWNPKAKTGKIWIVVPRIPAHDEATMRMYYGNPSATSTAAGGATFLFFEDFTGNEINHENWFIYDNRCSLENGYLVIPPDNIQLRSMIGFTRPIVIRFRSHMSANENAPALQVTALASPDFRYGKTGTGYTIKIPGNQNPSRSGGVTKGSDTVPLGSSVPLTFDTTTDTISGLDIANKTVQAMWNGIKGPVLADDSLRSGNLVLGTLCPGTCKGNVSIDWIYVRKSATQEPAVTLTAESPASALLAKAASPTPFPGEVTATPQSPGFHAILSVCGLMILIIGIGKNRQQRK